MLDNRFGRVAKLNLENEDVEPVVMRHFGSADRSLGQSLIVLVCTLSRDPCACRLCFMSWFARINEGSSRPDSTRSISDIGTCNKRLYRDRSSSKQGRAELRGALADPLTSTRRDQIEGRARANAEAASSQNAVRPSMNYQNLKYH